jgi:hypothetical protein
LKSFVPIVRSWPFEARLLSAAAAVPLTYTRAYCPNFDLIEEAGVVRFDLRDRQSGVVIRSAKRRVAELDEFTLPHVRWRSESVIISAFDGGTVVLLSLRTQ